MNRPSEVLTRLSDALFFYMDQNCDIPGLRGTGVIEIAKYLWLCAKLGNPAELVSSTCSSPLLSALNIP